MDIHSRLYQEAKGLYDKIKQNDDYDAQMALRREARQLLKEAHDNVGSFDLKGVAWKYMRLLNSRLGNPFRQTRRRKK